MQSSLDTLRITLAVSVVAVAASMGAKADETTNVASSNILQHNRMFHDHGGFGVGVIVGEPTGFTFKGWLSDKTAVDLGAAWSFENEEAFQLHGDYLIHKFDLFPVDQGELPLYFGVGGRVKFEDEGDTRVGVRLPVGISYLFAGAPVELFAEVAPIIDVAPSTELKFNGGIGVRYYFR